ncbi:hypothetical protein ACFPER_16635 [Agromyces aurantiacus]|uniref:Antibiotic biosynthesis monooxygenase n=1 Tax=Agromyces aurantiacus TaxID=165814 RepID=A0ABV9R9D4_9MICO|nr:hypothetical protein [Agromyces aurantiacus]MBM7504681.1 antibiotic biosynthesis monooxygenase (ABM) superfamily enzyme [Agromyces aurantiacus]
MKGRELGDAARASTRSTLTIRRRAHPGRARECDAEFAELLSEAAAIPGWVDASVLANDAAPVEYEVRLHFSSCASPVHPPPRYKLALLTWLGIFPLITVILAIAGPLIQDLHVIVRSLILTACVVPLMTWLVMPFLTWAAATWLNAQSGGRSPTA